MGTIPRLRRVEGAPRQGSEIFPLLQMLAERAPAGSEESAYAHRQLAELIVESDPWQASVFARIVLRDRPKDDRSWAVLALAQTLQGNYRFARTAYEKALELSPMNPWYAHNLGHLLDVALNLPKEALPWLSLAHHAVPNDADVLASYAHATARVGDGEQARELLGLAASPTGEHVALLDWIDRGAPPPSSEVVQAKLPRERRARRVGLARARTTLEAASARLPMGEEVRNLAKTYLDESLWWMAPTADPAVLPAACAYAAIYVCELPLSVGEVSATFRVRTKDVRATFAELRSVLEFRRRC